MKKIYILFVSVIITFLYFACVKVESKNTFPESEAVINCQKGDKILNYYEKLQNPPDPNRYLNAARYYYYQASRLDLSNPDALVGHARVALHQNRLKDAKNVLMIALNFNEINPKVNYYLGETFFREGEYTQAIDFYNQAYMHGYRYDYKTNYKMGLCYEKMDDIPKAKYHYNNAIKIRPDSMEAVNRLNGLDEINKNYKKQKTQDEEEVSTDDIKKLNMPQEPLDELIFE